jgi:5'-3' exonuclease
MTDKILLIDYMNYCYRGAIVFSKPADNAENKTDDKPTVSFNIVFNFFRNLRATCEAFAPNKVILCLEGQRGLRYNLFPEYKANRLIKIGSDDAKNIKKLAAREDFDRQRDIVLDLVKYLPLTTVHADTFEADDILATLAENLKDEEVIVISGDKDIMQLLQKEYKNIKLFSYNRKDYIVAPQYHQMTFLCLNGDKDDNIPKLVSEKIAIKLASDPKALIEFLESEENRANYMLNKSLVELRIIDDDKLIFGDYNVNYDILKEKFVEMDFKSIVEDKYWNKFVGTFNELR